MPRTSETCQCRNARFIHCRKLSRWPQSQERSTMLPKPAAAMVERPRATPPAAWIASPDRIWKAGCQLLPSKVRYRKGSGGDLTIIALSQNPKPTNGMELTPATRASVNQEGVSRPCTVWTAISSKCTEPCTACANSSLHARNGRQHSQAGSLAAGWCTDCT